jgi:serine/threonine protein kinase
VAELAPHGSLRDELLRIEERDDTVAAVVGLEVGLQVCSAMEQLAALKIVHRDLRAANVLVFKWDSRKHLEVHVKVTDFGLSRTTVEASYYYGVERVVPVRWTAPEALRRHKFGERSDVWSFGVVMWEVFSLGDVPFFESPRDADVIRAVTGEGRLERPEGCPAGIFDGVLRPCWAAKPQDRPTFSALVPVIRCAQEAVLVEAAQQLCAICEERPSRMAFAPCGHECLCDHPDCTAPFPVGSKCIICRAPCTGVMRVFRAGVPP